MQLKILIQALPKGALILRMIPLKIPFFEGLTLKAKAITKMKNINY
jgi:hypothetical protein